MRRTTRRFLACLAVAATLTGGTVAGFAGTAHASKAPVSHLAAGLSWD